MVTQSKNGPKAGKRKQISTSPTILEVKLQTPAQLSDGFFFLSICEGIKDNLSS